MLFYLYLDIVSIVMIQHRQRSSSIWLLIEGAN